MQHSKTNEGYFFMFTCATGNLAMSETVSNANVITFRRPLKGLKADM